MIQSLHENLTGDELNALLAEGAVVAHLYRDLGVGRWHVVIDQPEPGDVIDEAAVVLQFLQSVNPAALQEAMNSRVRLSEGPAVSALQALAAMVHPEPTDGPPGA